MLETNNIFNFSRALELVKDNSSEFKVSFDELWVWCGYSRKDSAKRMLVSNFEEGTDFLISVENTSINTLGRSVELIYLTVDTSKQFAMLAETANGKAVRRYFMEAEKAYRQIMNSALTIQPTQSQSQLDPNVKALVQSTALIAQSIQSLSVIVNETNTKVENQQLVLEQVKEVTDTLVIPDGYQTIYSYSKTIPNFRIQPKSDGAESTAITIGRYMAYNKFNKHSEKFNENGYDVSVYLNGEIEKALVQMIENNLLVLTFSNSTPNKILKSVKAFNNMKRKSSLLSKVAAIHFIKSKGILPKELSPSI